MADFKPIRFKRRIRKYRSLRNNGPGRTRIKMAEMLKEQHGIDIDPADLFTNNTPAYRLMDLCRWGGDGIKDGRHIHVCSWSTMTEIIKHGTICIISNDPYDCEISEGPSTYKTEMD